MIDYNFSESGFECYRFCYKPYSEGYKAGSVYLFIYVSTGFITFTTPEREYVANEKEMFFIPCNKPLTCIYNNHNKNEPCTGTGIHVRFFAGVEQWDYPTQVFTPSDEALKAMNSIPSTNSSHPKKDCSFMQRMFTFLELVQNSMIKNENKHFEIIEKAQEYMFKNDRYSISDVANFCNVSESFLFKIFSKYVTMSPVKMKQKIQAEKAERLLRETNLTIDEIANKVGFDSTAHFRKVFKSRFYISPNAIRKKYKSEP